MQAQNTSFIGDFKTLARYISLVENEADGFEAILQGLSPRHIPVIGFTGPPGAGKSTLLNAVTGRLLQAGKKIGLVLIDPSSPFNLGALLGDRLRMSTHFNDGGLFIRSLATRGSLGGLSDKIIEVTEVMRAYAFDYIFVETVGVGQSEVEIAGLADVTVVVLVPEGGDSIQAMKAGLMEIADIFVVNKADRPESEAMLHALNTQLHISAREHLPVLKTVAAEGKGISGLIEALGSAGTSAGHEERRLLLLRDKALRLIQKERMKNFGTGTMLDSLRRQYRNEGFNLYSFVRKYMAQGL